MVDVSQREMCGYVVFEIRGEISGPSDLTKVQRALEKTISEGKEDVAVDLHNAEYINSGLISFFINWKKTLEQKEHKFCLIEPSPKAGEILKLTGIEAVVPIYKNEVEFMQRA
ncbi:MAG: hypothetical protein A2487_03430 [Candidatus Raymondbacteria bacterium RifOxyC12_full_50_8]|uniref:STAS domain-containing protein n=1 Tax=Candidatus Raymondbacteria bacterium RIFOXYD12_FULL_49_13 TaxID=1817890 RepID=A0A1F7F731_UNCRA|nr:MAG: hypothetical protein A2248_21905 [Candidatus Raymondbacteria bacterium RIFOXYA2_FULL_49_16]OGJ96273.1 MAG: hypothetical protein A2453_08775 [Candidatus Raymondbacteria bacterium RIFOXYC2_FULL_50_21]OGK00353.1 MAG: hypothetical protein A2350_03490 [Candidatus Raymondbacteria bacterium RifOxyB12_full_50_8]OGK02480.1 MAG: hypothetical protein A2519_12120 [Candidatus Raymondbacteria bacterium RIFOXYD12_FULL_49_13]OGK05812.1 MAG: hypothetical protein A2487_03430 [Candidatus Raymondbacteria b